MASKWLNRARRRAKENFLQKLGAHARDEDPEFQAAQERFAQLSAGILEVFTAARAFLDVMIAVSEAAATLDTALERCGVLDGGDGDEAVAAFSETTRSLQRRVMPAFVRSYVETALEPCSALLEQLPEVQQKLKERHALHLDLDSYRARVKNTKQDEPEWQRLDIKRQRAENKVGELSAEILKAIDKLGAEKPAAVADTAAAIVAAQAAWMEGHLCAMEDLLPRFPTAAVTLCRMHELVEATPEHGAPAVDLRALRAELAPEPLGRALSDGVVANYGGAGGRVVSLGVRVMSMSTLQARRQRQTQRRHCRSLGRVAAVATAATDTEYSPSPPASVAEVNGGAWSAPESRDASPHFSAALPPPRGTASAFDSNSSASRVDAILEQAGEWVLRVRFAENRGLLASGFLEYLAPMTTMRGEYFRSAYADYLLLPSPAARQGVWQCPTCTNVRFSDDDDPEPTDAAAGRVPSAYERFLYHVDTACGAVNRRHHDIGTAIATGFSRAGITFIAESDRGTGPGNGG